MLYGINTKSNILDTLGNMKEKDEWAYNKKIRELAQNIEQYKIHANREIKNNKVCHPSKVRNNSQKYLVLCKKRYKEFTGKDYGKS